METHPIDSIIKKAINASEDFYNLDADSAKERIWNQVKTNKQPNPILIRLLIAACILLFIGTSIIAISNRKARHEIKALVELNKALKVKMDNGIALSTSTNVVISDANLVDTIYIEKKVTVNKPVITIKQITDTVFVEKLVFIEKEMTSNLLTTLETSGIDDVKLQSAGNNFETEILISTNEPTKPTKRKKMQIRFGGNKEKTNNGTLAFSTEFK